MNISRFDSLNNHSGHYNKIEEAKRLANELRAIPAHLQSRCKSCPPIFIEAKKGFDIETCPLSDIIDYFRTHPKISRAKTAFLYRIVAVRFPMDYRIMKKIGRVSPLEIQLIESQATNDMAWLGEVGFQNCVRLDKSASISDLKVVKRKNDEIRVMRK